MNYNRQTLTAELTEVLGFALRDSKQAVDLICDFIVNMANGDRLELRALGTFTRKDVTAKARRNPHTGTINDHIEPYTTIRFKPSKKIRRKA